MTQQLSVWVVLLLAIAGANLPFFSERILLLGPLRRPKAFVWRMLELFLLATLTISVGWILEASIGQRAPQRWEFFVAFACLFVTLGFPGFVWCYLRRGYSVANHG